ncbi:MAG: hypothetical protein WC785_00880 [Tatlockia sp.]|jgi:hypothetical protein
MRKNDESRALLCSLVAEDELFILRNALDNYTWQALINDWEQEKPAEERHRLLVHLFLVSLVAYYSQPKRLNRLWSSLKNKLHLFFQKGLVDAGKEPHDALTEDNNTLPRQSELLQALNAGLFCNDAIDSLLHDFEKKENRFCLAPYEHTTASQFIKLVLGSMNPTVIQELISSQNIAWFILQPGLTPAGKQEMVSRMYCVLDSKHPASVEAMMRLTIEERKALDWLLLQPSLNETTDYSEAAYVHIRRIASTRIAPALNYLAQPFLSEENKSPLFFLVKKCEQKPVVMRQVQKIVHYNKLNNAQCQTFLLEIINHNLLTLSDLCSLDYNDRQIAITSSGVTLETHQRKNIPVNAPPGFSIETPATMAAKLQSKSQFFEPSSKRQKKEDPSEQHGKLLALLKFIYQQLNDLQATERVNILATRINAFHAIMNQPELYQTLGRTPEEQEIIDVSINNLLIEKLEAILPLFKETRLFKLPFRKQSHSIPAKEYCANCSKGVINLIKQLKSQALLTSDAELTIL